VNEAGKPELLQSRLLRRKLHALVAARRCHARLGAPTCAASRPCSRSCWRSTRSQPTATRSGPWRRRPCAPPAPGLGGRLRGLPHGDSILNLRSLLKIRGGSVAATGGAIQTRPNVGGGGENRSHQRCTQDHPLRQMNSIPICCSPIRPMCA
jgi:hypothetical protein